MTFSGEIHRIIMRSLAISRSLSRGVLAKQVTTTGTFSKKIVGSPNLVFPITHGAHTLLISSAAITRNRSETRSATRSYVTASKAHAKPPLYGQPVSTTHPHLIKSQAELTRDMPAGEYEARRKKLMASLPEGSVVICMGSTVRLVTQRELHLVSKP